MNTKNLIRRFSFTGLPKRVYDLEENQIPEGEEGQLLSWDEAGNPVAIDGDSSGAVESVNGETGVVVLDAESVGALPDDYTPTWAEVTGKPSTFPPTIGTTSSTAKAGDYAPTWGDVTGKPTTFAPIIGSTAITAMAGNTALLTIGTTSSTAKAGDYTPTWAEVTGKPSTFPPTIGTTSSTAKAGDYQPTWVQVTGKPAIIASGATQAEARTAIGAGTGNSNLAIGTTSTTAMAGNTPLLTIGTTAATAKAGNYTPTATEVVTALQNMTPQQIEDIQTLLGITP